ncbi:hypothetical protein M3J09_007992 [Ascochyta lentis]
MADSDKEAEFAFNLFSDIAPLLALFGDQFARQFTSESLTWVDHLIFAMVPLGILTAITGAIRVQGPRIAKSFIGRGRENRALAEIELMSSTSKEVCELFNGKSIIRAMGRPKLAQILVYPLEYKNAKTNNESIDSQRLISKSGDTRDGINKGIPNHEHTEAVRPAVSTTLRDLSCGIHTFETATSDPGSGPELLATHAYHSKSYQVIMKLLCSVAGKKNPLLQDRLKPRDVLKWLGPPNLQLGLSSDQFQQNFPTGGQEAFIAAVIAVLLQCSLIAIATVTVYHTRTRRAIASEPQLYGYPCYLTGSVLLSVGIAICSLAVERSTVECNWTIYPCNHQNDETKLTEALSDELNVAQDKHESLSGELEKNGKNHPRLLWLQQSQEVNDQSFDGYAILAGPKHHLVTSSRIEDTGVDYSTGGTVVVKDRRQGDNGPDYVEHKHWSIETWEYITVGAAMAAGIGFIMQFMGLRGLTYPCSIAQLVAILLMAFVRAVIRRRLGREPSYCPAFARFEIDFLTTRMVYYGAVRNFDLASKGNISLLNRQNPRELLCWRVKTARRNSKAFFAKTLHDLREERVLGDTFPIPIDESELLFHETDQVVRGTNTPQTTKTFASLPIDEASSQHLLQVRERLGDLCEWRSEALESARSLVYSVEAFMDSFFPKTINSFDWVVETIGLSTVRGISRSDYVSIPVQRIKGKWNVGIGVIEAILSLWMASVEAQAADLRRTSVEEHENSTSKQKSETPNWRRRKLGVDMRYDFRRILGDDFKDGTLKRDLSWWVSETLIEQSEEKRISNKTAVTGTEHEDANLKSADTGFLPGGAKLTVDALEMVIGFNGLTHRLDPRRVPVKEERKELAIVSNGLLPNILAQHLFTSFMWTVVGQLPEDCLRQSISSSEPDVDIEGRHAFDAHHFSETWSRPTLRHRQLIKLVQQLVNFGIGTQDEILLCMIPAFSFKDLLPNHVILKLIPQVRLGQGWAETARCYNRLLEQSMRVTSHEIMAEEKFCYNVLVATIDFLIFASEPYDGYIDPPQELNIELEGIVCRLISTRFAPVVKKLAQAYCLQRRYRDIARIFKLFSTEASVERINKDIQFGRVFGTIPDMTGCLDALQAPNHPDFFFLEKTLGFSKTYRVLYEALSGIFRDEPSISTRAYQFQHNRAKARDIFDWTPLHYAALLETSWENRALLDRYFDPKDVKENLSIHKIVGPFGRSPLHMTAISRSYIAARWISKCLGTEENKRNAYSMAGTDGMSPLHLATKSGNVEMVYKIIQKKRMRTTTTVDFWRRSAIHLATRYGRVSITSVLLREDSQIDNADEIGMTPLEYLFERGGGSREIQVHEEKHPGQASSDCREAGSGQEINTDLVHTSEDGAFEDLHKADSGSVHHEESNAEQVPEDEDPRESDKSGTETISDPQQDTEKMNSQSPDDDEPSERKQKIFVDIASKKLDYHDDRNRTLLYYAIQNTNIKTIGQLISKGYELESKDAAGMTPLHFAIQIRKSKIALKLLRALPGYDGTAASASSRDDRGYTPLMFAAENGCMDVVKYFVETLPRKMREERERLPDEEKLIAAEHRAGTRLGGAEADSFGPLARDTSGKTALHIALSQGVEDVATYLLQGPGDCQEVPVDGHGNTLLVAACGHSNLAACVPLILDKWPGFINNPDATKYKQTPLSLACEAGTESVVDSLLEFDGTDVNAKATGWEDKSCLHAAVVGNCLSIVKMLVRREDIRINERDFYGETALETARSNSEIAKVLLLHKQTESKARLEFLSQNCTHRDEDYQKIVPDILPYVDDADITDEVLVGLIDVSEELWSSEPFIAFVRRAFERGTTLERPYHKAARVGSPELLGALQVGNQDPNELDEDGWSYIEYAETYRESPLNDNSTQIVPSARLKRDQSQKQGSKSIRPGLLHESWINACATIEQCSKPKHKECMDVHVLEVVSSNDNLRATIRTINCVPPASAKSEVYYFEVKILAEAKSRYVQDLSLSITQDYAI